MKKWFGTYFLSHGKCRYREMLLSNYFCHEFGQTVARCNGPALDRVTKQKHRPNRQKLSKKCPKIAFSAPPDNFRTFFAFPVSGLSDDLPVTTVAQKQAEYGFGEYGFKHRTQWVFWGSLSSGERTQWVHLGLLFVCQSELTEFLAELTEFAAELSEAQWVLFSETVLSKQYSATVTTVAIGDFCPSRIWSSTPFRSPFGPSLKKSLVVQHLSEGKLNHDKPWRA